MKDYSQCVISTTMAFVTAQYGFGLHAYYCGDCIKQLLQDNVKYRQ